VSDLTTTPRRPAVGIAAVPGRVPDAVDILATDHRGVDLLLRRLAAAGDPEDPERARDLLDVAIAELARHITAEEQYLYPAVRRYLRDGDRLAARERAAARRIGRLAGELMGTLADEDSFAPLVARLAREVRAHASRQQRELFGRLRADVDRRALVRLGTDLLSAKKLAPTRPHPAGPHHPWLSKVTSPVLALVDHAVDSLTDRPTTVAELPDPPGASRRPSGSPSAAG
jgi:hypothetical protein